jgi:hypothetical protein
VKQSLAGRQIILCDSFSEAAAGERANELLAIAYQTRPYQPISDQLADKSKIRNCYMLETHDVNVGECCNGDESQPVRLGRSGIKAYRRTGTT